MGKNYNVGIIGATGMVGAKIYHIAERTSLVQHKGTCRKLKISRQTV